MQVWEKKLGLSFVLCFKVLGMSWLAHDIWHILNLQTWHWWILRPIAMCHVILSNVLMIIQGILKFTCTLKLTFWWCMYSRTQSPRDSESTCKKETCTYQWLQCIEIYSFGIQCNSFVSGTLCPVVDFELCYTGVVGIVVLWNHSPACIIKQWSIGSQLYTQH